MPGTVLFELAPAAVAALVCALAMWPLMRLAPRLNLVDRPGGRKRHARVTPVVGGLGIAAGLIAGAAVAIGLHGGIPADYWPLAVAATVLLICGAVDDARDLGSRSKLLVQLAAALIVCLWGGRVLTDLGAFPVVGTLGLGPLAVAVSVLFIIGFVNAFNMVDGVDGLAGGVGLVMVFWLGAAAWLQGGGPALALPLVTLGALLGFLAFNLRSPLRTRASVFLGDAGSLVIGLVIAWFAMELLAAPDRVVSPAALGWVVALPVVDTLSLMVRRVLKGRSPFVADREHLHHIFLRAGYREGEAAALLILGAFTLGGVGVLGASAGMPDVLLAAGLLLVAVMHFVFIRYAWRTVKALRRLHRFPAMRRAEDDLCGPQGASGRAGRRLALIGLYLGLFFLPLSPLAMQIGLTLVVLATVLCLRDFWADVRRLPVFWCALTLTAYVGVRGAMDAPALGSGDALGWLPVMAVAGLPALVLGWWVQAFQRHWLWLFMALVAGGAVGFAAEADWTRLNAGLLDQRSAWGPVAVTGSLSAVALVMLFACCVAGLSRLGRGWRPAFLLATGTLLAIPVLVVLVATRYTTGWLGALFGGLALGVAVIAYGAGRRERVGSVLGAILLAAIGVLAWKIVTSDATIVRDAFIQPLRAGALYLGGEPQLAFEVYPTTAQRLQLWEQAAARLAERPWFGWGDMTPAATARRADFSALYPSLAVGFGVVGLGLFAVVWGLFLRAMLAVGRQRLWSPAMVGGVLGGTATVAVMMLLGTQIVATPTRAVVVLLTAVHAAAMFRRQARRKVLLAAGFRATERPSAAAGIRPVDGAEAARGLEGAAPAPSQQGRRSA